MGVTGNVSAETPQDVVNYAYAVAHGANQMQTAINDRDEFIREFLRDLTTDADPFAMMRYWFERAEKFGVNVDGLDRERQHPAVAKLAEVTEFLVYLQGVTPDQAEAHEADENPLTKGYADALEAQIAKAWEIAGADADASRKTVTIPSDLITEVRDALEGDSNDSEHDALVYVAEALGISYTAFEDQEDEDDD